jgi:hypothetical protein
VAHDTRLAPLQLQRAGARSGAVVGVDGSQAPLSIENAVARLRRGWHPRGPAQPQRASLMLAACHVVGYHDSAPASPWTLAESAPCSDRWSPERTSMTVTCSCWSGVRRAAGTHSCGVEAPDHMPLPQVADAGGGAQGRASGAGGKDDQAGGQEVVDAQLHGLRRGSRKQCFMQTSVVDASCRLAQHSCRCATLACRQPSEDHSRESAGQGDKSRCPLHHVQRVIRAGSSPDVAT